MMFCSCSAKWFGAHPTTLTCEVCLGLPGALPYPNRKAIELSIAAGVALHCDTPEHTKFDRKNYMYPDLPKGYQISQYDLPMRHAEYVELDARRVRIRRAHLEEDTGRLVHAGAKLRMATAAFVVLTRPGVHLMAILSAR